MHELHGADDLRRRRVLEQEAGRTRAERAQDELVGIEGRQDHDRGWIRLGMEQARRLDAVDLRHADVHEHDIWVVRVDGGEDTAPIVHLSDDVDVLRTREHHPQARPDKSVVVDEQDSDRLAHGDHGRVARRTKSPDPSGPCRSSPPASATLSAKPMRPVPVPGV